MQWQLFSISMARRLSKCNFMPCGSAPAHLFLPSSLIITARKQCQSKSSEMNTCEKREGGGGGVMLRVEFRLIPARSHRWIGRWRLTLALSGTV